MSLDFDYGDFSKPSKKYNDFNDRQVELIEKLFANETSVTMAIIDSIAYRSEDFARLWARFVEIHGGDEAKATKTMRNFVKNRILRKRDTVDKKKQETTP
jgi:hypothetical protein